MSRKFRFIILVILFSPCAAFAYGVTMSSPYENSAITITGASAGTDYYFWKDGAAAPSCNVVAAGDGDLDASACAIRSGNYVIVDIKDETTHPVNFPEGCNNVSSDYCLANSGNIDQGKQSFSVVVKPPPAPEQGGGGPIAYTPEIVINSPKLNSSVGMSAQIDYAATDQNDASNKSTLGLPENPVSIFYSETGDIRKLKLIADKLPAVGIYKWNTKDLPEGDTYHIIVSATDNSNETGQAVSDQFTIDHSAPLFNVKIDPPVTRGEDVNVVVDSTKPLSMPPDMKVTQYRASVISVTLSGSGTHFEGVYKVVKGYDGPATITLSGDDTSGNTGTTILSGSQFSVGVNPPPSPIVTSPTASDVLTTDSVVVRGTSRVDTEVDLTVNGLEKYVALPNVKGEFTISNVKLNKDLNKGINYLNIFAKDKAGNVSAQSVISLKFNVTPEVSITYPESFDTIGTSTPIQVSAFDANKDKLIFTYEVSRDNGLSWTVLAASSTAKSFLWDTSKMPDGKYSIKVTADDSYVKVSKVVDNVLVNNQLATFYFTDGEKSVTNQTTFIIGGGVTSSTKISPRPIIGVIEYSMDGGKTWTAVSDTTIGSGGTEQKFQLRMTNLKQQTYSVLFRATDSRGSVSQIEKRLVVVFELPKTPTVNNITSGQVITDDTFSVSGEATAGNDITVTVGGATYSGKVDDGGHYNIGNIKRGNHGSDTIVLVAKDEAGNVSKPASVAVIFNGAPIVDLQYPREGRGVNHLAEISWAISDPDQDPIKNFKLEYRLGHSGSYKTLTTDPNTTKFVLDVSQFKESLDYELKITAGDGISNSLMVRNFSVDNTPPEITITPFPKRNYNKNFTLDASGVASDSFSGVEYVEYSVDAEHWFKAIVTDGFLTGRATYRIIHPFTLKDGLYYIQVRSIDAAGNTSEPVSQSIRVDTTAPRVGASQISDGVFDLLPVGDKVSLALGSSMKFKLSLEGDTKNASIAIDGKSTKLLLNPASGLWEANVGTPTQLGLHKLLLSAADDLGNAYKDKDIGSIDVVRLGKIMDSGNVINPKISVFVWDDSVQSFKKWQAEPYGEVNPLTTDSAGQYRLILPAGKYYLQIQTKGYERLKSSVFEFNFPQYVTYDFQLIARSGLTGYIGDLLDSLMINE